MLPAALNVLIEHSVQSVREEDCGVNARVGRTEPRRGVEICARREGMIEDGVKLKSRPVSARVRAAKTLHLPEL